MSTLLPALPPPLHNTMAYFLVPLSTAIIFFRYNWHKLPFARKKREYFQACAVRAKLLFQANLICLKSKSDSWKKATSHVNNFVLNWRWSSKEILKSSWRDSSEVDHQDNENFERCSHIKSNFESMHPSWNEWFSIALPLIVMMVALTV